MALTEKFQDEMASGLYAAYKKSPEADRIRSFYLQKCKLAVITAMQSVTKSLLAVGDDEIAVLFNKAHEKLSQAENALAQKR